MTLKPQPFIVPTTISYSFREGVKGDCKFISVPLVEADVEDLDQLCIQFRENVFKMAGKTDPRQPKNPRNAT